MTGCGETHLVLNKKYVKKGCVVLVHVINVTLEKYGRAIEYVRRTEMQTALNFVKVKGVCVGFIGCALVDLK